MTACVVVPWAREEELDAFRKNWHVTADQDWLLFEHDAHRTGCGATKNRGIRRAMLLGYDVVVVLDGDCYPSADAVTLEALVEQHVKALDPVAVRRYRTVTDPPSRGTPYAGKSSWLTMPVAASMGFWYGVPDYCAVRQLAFESRPMEFSIEPIYGDYFPLCGMNVAFKPREWWPWCQFIEVSRYDDIWMGWLWQREAYRRGHAFNLAGPMVTHARQSNVWRNLVDEARYAEETETLWQRIATHPSDRYADLLALVPAGATRLDVGEIAHADR